MEKLSDRIGGFVFAVLFLGGCGYGLYYTFSAPRTKSQIRTRYFWDEQKEKPKEGKRAIIANDSIYVVSIHIDTIYKEEKDKNDYSSEVDN